MLTRKQLASVARTAGIPLHVVERDYVQHLFLRRLDTDILVFKGGTCLRIAHGSPRYSEDLDFNAADGESGIDQVLRSAAADLGEYGVVAEVGARPGRAGGLHRRLRFAGPLFDGNDRSRGAIRLEVSLRREAVDADPVFVPKTPYADVPQLSLRTLSLPHLLAEKARALAVRRKPRDFYDVDWLLLRGATCTRELLDRKMSIYGRRFTLSGISAGISRASRGWERDLSGLLGQVPPAKDAKKRVLAGLRLVLNAGKTTGTPPNR